MNEPISLNYHQAQAVAERAARIRMNAGRHTGLKGTELVIVMRGNPYYSEPHPENYGYYLSVEGRGSAPVPLFAKDLGYERDFAAARLPARDEYGHVQHADMDGIGWDEFDMTPQLRAIGWHSEAVSFESDASDEAQDRYSNSDSPDCSYWTPTPPEGAGWLLAAIYDTEDGPVALFVRSADESGVSGSDGQTFLHQTPPPPPASGEGEVQPSLAYIEITPMGIDHGLTADAYKLAPGIYRLYATPPAGAPAAAVPTLTDARILEIGHRKATTYAHRSDPKYHSYAFVPHTLIAFARAIERELRGPGAAAQVSENKEN